MGYAESKSQVKTFPTLLTEVLPVVRLGKVLDGHLFASLKLE